MPSYKLITVDAFPEPYDFVQMTDDSGKVWAVPTDQTNTDYQAYLALAEENK